MSISGKFLEYVETDSDLRNQLNAEADRVIASGASKSAGATLEMLQKDGSPATGYEDCARYRLTVTTELGLSAQMELAAADFPGGKAEVMSECYAKLLVSMNAAEKYSARIIPMAAMRRAPEPEPLPPPPVELIPKPETGLTSNRRTAIYVAGAGLTIGLMALLYYWIAL